jgi:hypothetical protein
MVPIRHFVVVIWIGAHMHDVSCHSLWQMPQTLAVGCNFLCQLQSSALAAKYVLVHTAFCHERQGIAGISTTILTSQRLNTLAKSSC